jgi:hypothetical protein
MCSTRAGDSLNFSERRPWMAIDARLREGLQRSLSVLAIDTERRLDDARRRGHRRLVIRRTLAAVTVIATIAIGAVAAPRVLEFTADLGHQPATTPSLAPDVSSTSPEPIWGTWRTEYACEEFVRGFEQAGVSALAARWLVNFGMQRGPVHQLANSGDLCNGAKKIQRIHDFRPNGYLRTYQGREIADDCRCYELVDGHTFVVLGTRGDPLTSLEYRIDGETLTFDAVLPGSCSSATCRGHFAWAVANYAVGTWHREA